MHNGTFDDRNDARLSVKQWLIANDARDYTHNNLRRLATDIVRADKDPVDDMRVAWREATYGLVKGVVEFAAEEMERAGLSRAMSDVIAGVRRVATELPGRSHRALIELEDALAALHRSLPHMNAVHAERSVRALELAVSMLHGRQAAGVAVAA